MSREYGKKNKKNRMHFYALTFSLTRSHTTIVISMVTTNMLNYLGFHCRNFPRLYYNGVKKDKIHSDSIINSKEF